MSDGKEVAADAAKLARSVQAHVSRALRGASADSRRDVIDACVAAMRGRWFGGKRIDASLWDGVTNYAKAGVRDDETEAEQNARLEKFAADLERA